MDVQGFEVSPCLYGRNPEPLGVLEDGNKSNRLLMARTNCDVVVFGQGVYSSGPLREIIPKIFISGPKDTRGYVFLFSYCCLFPNIFI